MPELVTSFGLLRPWRASDAPALVKYANNAKIAANLRDGFAHPYGENQARAFLEAATHQDPVTFYAIATPEEAIGSIGVTVGQDVHRLTAEMGYWLAEPYWGRGIMSEAVRRFTDYMFESLGLVRIYAEPYATNLASCHILEKSGFLLEGRLRSSVLKGGKILDQMMYAKVRQGEKTAGSS